MPKIEVSKSSQENLLKLPKNKQKIITRKILILKEDPLLGKRLSGKLKSFFSLKIWPYRIIYDFDKKKKKITIHKIQHRQNVYKK